MPEDTGFYIDDVCIPHTWFPIEDGVNDSILYRVNNVERIAFVPAGNYSVASLGLAIVSAMNSAAGVDFSSPFTT